MIIGLHCEFCLSGSIWLISISDGKSLTFALEKEISKTFLELAILCKAVICCKPVDFSHTETWLRVRNRSCIPVAEGIGGKACQEESEVHSPRYRRWCKRCQHDSGRPCRCWYIGSRGMKGHLIVPHGAKSLAGSSSCSVCRCRHLTVPIPQEATTRPRRVELHSFVEDVAM